MAAGSRAFYPRDIDVAARFDPYDPGAVLAFLDELADAAGTDQRASFDAAAGVAGDRGGGGSRLMERYGSESSLCPTTALQ